MRSPLVVSDDNDRRAFILPLAFSDVAVIVLVLVVGLFSEGRDVSGRVSVCSWPPRPASRSSPENEVDSMVKAGSLSFLRRRDFSWCALSTDTRSCCGPSFLSRSAWLACSSLIRCTRWISRSPRVRVNVPSSSKVFCAVMIAYRRLGLSERWWNTTELKTSSLGSK